MKEKQSPFYINWSFWTVAVSLLAVVLSQLPPVYQWFGHPRLHLESLSQIIVTQKIGNPQVQMSLILSNEGTKAAVVTGIAVTLKRNGETLAVLPAIGIYQNTNDQIPSMFAQFVLRPQDQWFHIVNCINPRSREDEETYQEATRVLKSEIARLRNKPSNSGEPIVFADTKYAQPFLAMFNKLFVWKSGEYEILISVTARPSTASLQAGYRFTLFESESNKLMNSKQGFKAGDGIYWDSGNYPGVGVPVYSTHSAN